VPHTIDRRRGISPGDHKENDMAKNEQPGHHTAHKTQKHQCNGPIVWAALFRSVVGPSGQVGDGVRAALAYAATHPDAFRGWAKAHPDAWARASTGPARAKAPGRAAKAAGRAAKRAGAKAAAKAGGKAKAPKTGALAKVSKALGKLAKAAGPEQQSLPEVK
jgi:hypothetical protein